MARNTTTKDFREHAVAMVISGKSELQVANELNVEVQKVKRWYKAAISDRHKNTELFENTLLEKQASEAKAQQDKKIALESSESLSEGIQADPKKKRLIRENKQLKAMVNFSAQWISAYIAMMSETHTGR